MMKRHRKKIHSIAAVLLAALLTAACGSGTGNPDAASTGASRQARQPQRPLPRLPLKKPLPSPLKRRITGHWIPLIPGSWKAGPETAALKWKLQTQTYPLPAAAVMPKKIIP